MASHGIDSGPYLVIPFLGPSTLRDAMGKVVGFIADPVTVSLQRNDKDQWIWIGTALKGVDFREQNYEKFDNLNATSDKPSNPTVEFSKNLATEFPAFPASPCNTEFIVVQGSDKLFKKFLIPVLISFGRINLYPLASGASKYLSNARLNAKVLLFRLSQGS